MLEIDKSLERFFTDGAGQRIPEIHVYGPRDEIVGLIHNPATTGTRIVPHHTLEEGGAIITSLPSSPK